MQKFLPGGSRPDCQKTARTTFVLVINLFYCFTEGVNWLFQSKLELSKVSGGSNTYQGGGSNFFQGDPNAKFYRNGYNL